MGTILHTGDFRFTPSMFDNPILFPYYLRNELNSKISIHIDELLYDNTFCDKVFKFP